MRETQTPPGGAMLSKVPGGDVHDVAEHVVTVDDHGAVVDPDPELHRRMLRFPGRPPHHGFLDGDRSTNRGTRVDELDQQPVAHRLDDATALGGEGRVDDLLPNVPQAR
ncbi:MAG: hypothetical protein V9E96_03140 [Chitinophagaceae bacterium]